jgi:site-specific DNA-methyltransferase (adenine-specific)
MSLPKPYYEHAGITIYHADCRDILPHLPKVDLVLTDPPYGINTKSDGFGKINPWGDLCNAAFWYADWMKTCRSLLNSDGALWTFLNWRSMVTFQKASCDIAWPIESLLIWDKCWIGPGGMRGLRPSYEMAALFAMPDFAIPDRGIPDIKRSKWSSHKPNGHPAEKPLELMKWLIENSNGPEIILDLFMGSGTTLAAAKLLSKKAIGIELEEKYCEIAARRLEQDSLFMEADA